MRSPLLFAYGTLVTGTGNKPFDRMLRKKLVPIEPATIRGRIIDAGRYPGVVPNTLGARIAGVLLRIDDSRRLIRLMDRYEDYDRNAQQTSEYVRQRTTVRLNSSGRHVQAWVYWYRGRQRRLVPRTNQDSA